MMTTMMKRRAPEVRATLVADLLDEAREAIQRIGQRDAQIAPLAKMNREDWLKIGEALSDLRKKHKSTNEFGAAVREAGLDQGCCKNAVQRSDAIWCYDNRDLIAIKTEGTDLNSPTHIRHYLRGLDSEPTIDIKVATTEHPIVVAAPPAPVAPVKPQRPPCPGVVGDEPGEYFWSIINNGWVKHLGSKSRETAKPSTPENDIREARDNALPNMSMRDWAIDYLKFCKHESVVKIVETIRRCEFPDHGGSVEVTKICNLYLSKEN